MQNKEQNLEPILQENADRFVLFPIEHDDIWQEAPVAAVKP